MADKTSLDAPETESLGADFWSSARVVMHGGKTSVIFVVEVASKDGLCWGKWGTYSSEQNALLAIKKILPRPGYPTNLELARIVRIDTIRREGSIHQLHKG